MALAPGCDGMRILVHFIFADSQIPAASAVLACCWIQSFNGDGAAVSERSPVACWPQIGACDHRRTRPALRCQLEGLRQDARRAPLGRQHGQVDLADAAVSIRRGGVREPPTVGEPAGIRVATQIRGELPALAAREGEEPDVVDPGVVGFRSRIRNERDGRSVRRDRGVAAREASLFGLSIGNWADSQPGGREENGSCSAYPLPDLR